MFYIIYKTTNLVNSKFYIGKHQTKDLNDGYMGSGKLLKSAIKKYGIKNFHREILRVCQSEKEMNILEKVLVVPDRELNYNLCDGGKGGFGYINKNGIGDKVSAGKKSRKKTDLILEEKHGPNWRSVLASKPRKPGGGRPGFFTGKKHSEEWKQNHSSIMRTFTGEKSSQFGTMWITNGAENKKIKKVDNIPEGWYKGRKI